MRTTTKLATVFALVAAGLVHSSAQTSVTNLIQNVNFKFTAYYQGADSTISGGTKRNAGRVTIQNNDIINLLGLQLNKVFPSGSKLLGVTTLGVDVVPRIVVRSTPASGTNVDTDVSQYFYATLISHAENTTIKTNPFTVNGTSYNLVSFTMAVDSAHFTVRGFSASSVGTVKVANVPAGTALTANWNVSGSGDYKASVSATNVPVTLTGTASLTGRNIQIQ
jgi:hypothetical protein